MGIGLVIILIASLYLAGDNVYEKIKQYENNVLEEKKKNNFLHYKYYKQKVKELLQ
jgi:hypothetical protein